MRDDSERLTDLLEAIGRIEKYTNDGRATLDQELVQIWVLHHLMIIGEACRGLSPQFRMDHPQDVWTQAAGLRNVIVHEYFGVDAEIIWDVVVQDLPELKERVKGLLSLENTPPPGNED